MEIHCARCKQELERQGALLFSPPTPLGAVTKVHLCQSCYSDVISFIAETLEA